MRPSKRSIVILLVLGLALAAPASAVTFYDIDSLAGVKLSATGLSQISGSLDVTAAGIEGDQFTIWLPYLLLPRTRKDAGGFTVGTHTALAATFEVWVRDDFDIFRSEYLLVNLGGTQTFGPIEVDFGVIGIGVSGNLLAVLDASGRLDFTLSATRGDFHVDFVGLKVRAGTLEAAIPEVGSLRAYALGSLLISGFALRQRRGR